MPVYRLSLLILICALPGCASLSRNECLNADWYGIGYEDGLRGRAPVHVAGHRKACADHGIAPDLERYNEGREAGLAWYCEPRNGFRLGLQGQGYQHVCPAHLEADFLRAWSGGRDIQVAEYQVRRLNEILAVNRAQLETLAQERSLAEHEFIERGTSIQRRAHLMLELRDNEQARALVEHEIAGIESAIAQERAHLASLRQNARQWENPGQTSQR